MSRPANTNFPLPPVQQPIRDKCFHPSGTFVEFPIEEIEQSISDRFEKIVRLYPEQLAVKMGDRALTYDELNRAANRIARAILNSQELRQEPVIVLFEQGVEALAAILGALKAGKFYVPVNPSFPNARIATIVDDAQSGLLITDNKNIAVARSATKNLLNIDEIDANVSSENLSLPLSPDDLAYIIYTSGTTGKPKGVFQRQRNVLQWTLVHSNAIHICAADRLALMHSHSTSGGTHRMYDALLNGAALFPFDFRADGVKLASWILDEHITIYQSGPLVFRQWLDALNGAEPFPDLRLIRLSGMAMTAEDVARYRSHFSSDCLLVQVLGTSEGGTIPHYFIDKSSKVSESPMPVGYSVGDAEAFVVDESGRRVEPEVVGEIAIRSRYLACGYWRNAELTNEKFLSDPEGSEERLYLTGDLGRMSADGCLYHLGRKDLRVKIRGYSVEISEIESTLREHPAIKEVVVISSADARGEPQLIAYFVPAAATGLTASALRNYLIDKLPEYAVPSIFATLPAMPLTPNGKIDRKALPAPPDARPELEAAYVAPRTPLEQELKNIWSEVLGLDDIGVCDNFFDLGGHSLRATQVLARIRQFCQVEIPLQKFFAAPTLAALADYIENPRPESGRASIVPLDRVARGPALPLSFAQQRLWFLDQLEPGSARYNVALVLQITGRLDVQILQRSLDEILKRHESLRTVFAVNDGQPCQKILPVVTIQLPSVDLTEIGSQASRSRAIEQFTVEQAHRPFDLVCGPLMRCRLLFLDQMQHVLLLTLHHIAFDGWSGAILMRELTVLYAAFSAGKASPLPDLRIQYADYAAWQAGSLRGPGTAELLAYWKKQLANLSPLRLPTDRPRRSVPSCGGARIRFSLSTATTQGLNALGRQENATLFMLLLTAFQTLLHRYTGQTDIVTGTPVGGRPHAEVEKLIGFFLNMLVLRVDLSGDPTLREALARTRKTCLDAYAHEELPFEILVKELKPERTLDQNPLFQVSFVLQNFPKAPFEATDITAVELDIDPGIARFDLHVFMTEEKDRLKGYFEYNTDLFDAATIERMVGHFQTLLEGIVANPEQRISDLPLLSKAERQRLLVEWNDTETDCPKDKAMSTSGRNTLRLPPEQEAIRAKCLHPDGGFIEFTKEETEQSIAGRFEKIVRKFPHRLAVKAGDRSLSYEALNQAANRVARAILAKCGQGSEPIALLFDHGIDAIVAIFGVLKAGKFYFALDPLFPTERIAYMLEDSQARLIVTNDRNANLAHRLTAKDRGFLNINQIDDSFFGENVALAASPDDVAAIVYTSGSTGNPKAVVQNHRNHLCSVMVNSNEMHISFHDRLTLLHSISFGSSRGHLFQALLNGASLFLYDIKAKGVYPLPAWLSKEQITVFHSPPTVFRQLAELLPGQKKLSSLRLIRLSGAPITEPDFDLYRTNFSLNTLLEIHLGSTETRAICFAIVDHTFAFPKQGFPVGYACPDKKVFLLNEDGDEVEPGEAGEIAVQGSNLNPTYWKKPELGSAKFLPDPSEGNERIYLTGDLGRMLPDGFLIHLGRKDLMVKIRGYRVEIAEIERALAHHPQVKEAAVLARDIEPGEQCLIAYIVARPDQAPASDELYDFLKDKLPDYMMPSSFVFLESLPLVNGKLDRTALPLPDKQRPNLRTPYVQPHSELQQKLSQMWAEVLSLDRVGAHDNFFDLGGHSLAATRLISRVLDSFRVEVSLKSLFESPTLAGFAQRVEDALYHARRGRFLPLIHVSRGSSLPASFAQRALWFHHQLEPGSCAYNLVSAYRLSGGLDVKALEQSVNQIIDRHEVLRTVFEAVDGQPVQTILPEMRIELPVINLSSAASDSVRESEVRRIAGALAGQPFNLTRGPLLRTALLRLSKDEHVLLVAIHHIVFDAWSIGIFARELSLLYNSSRTGEPSSLPQLTIQYGDFAVWQTGLLQGVNLETLLSYWKNQLERLPTLMLPSGRSQAVLDARSSARENFVLAKELSADLRELSDRAGTTLFMVLLAAYKIALHRYTGQTDIAIGTPVAGRNHPQVEGLIGFFLNMLVLRTDLSGNPTFRELLERIRKVCVDAFAHQDLPFEKLVEELRPKRDLTHNPLIQVTFALQNTPRCPVNLTGVTAQDLDISAGVARIFDLHLFMVEEVMGLRGCMTYNTNLFDVDMIARFISHLRNLLEGIVANADQRISDLPMLSEAEKQQLLADWNDTKKEYTKDKCIHELFESQVEKSPDRVAVVFEDQRLTYRELNRQANQLAHYLRELGVGPEVLVGICMEPSLEMIVGLIGILKAGGAYVPLDPAYPKERLGFMLEDSRVAVLLTQKELLSRFGEIQDGIVVCLDRDREEIDRQSTEKPEAKVTAENLAYTIYTSGSTGTPKGVLVNHSNVARLFTATDSMFHFANTDVWTLFHSIAFDFSVWEIWGALAHGGRLVVVPYVVSRSPEAFLKLLREQRVTVLNQTPSAFGQLIEAQALLPSATQPSLRLLIFGGEVLDLQQLKPWFDRHGDETPRLVNMYGITETTVHVTYGPLSAVDPSGGIGRPIADLLFYILDPYLQPVPIGIPGEIYVGGAGLARGYLNRPELTAERFLPNPYSDEPGARLYRSGDLARYRPDGAVEYLGRIDDQIKIRGYRIEVGEIETVLGQHAGVRRAVVVPQKRGPADERLVAYVVRSHERACTSNELRTFLKQKLPEHMIPSAFVFMDSLPLTPNGKLDRRVLPAPNYERPEVGEIYVAPRTPTEKIIAGIWAEILGVEQVGVHDNFFELGAHSLLATRVISRVRDALHVELPLRSLFEKPTVEGLAMMIVQGQAQKTEANELADILDRIESLSDADAQQLLARQVPKSQV